MSVTTIAKPTEDPHFVDARPSQVVAMHRADVLIGQAKEVTAVDGVLKSLSVQGADSVVRRGEQDQSTGRYAYLIIIDGRTVATLAPVGMRDQVRYNGYIYPDMNLAGARAIAAHAASTTDL